MPLKIASWNVNSLRVRLEHILSWLTVQQPDVLALQETKIPDKLFPQDVFSAAGYYSLFAGQKSYNGVAILSKKPLSDVMTYNIALAPLEQRSLFAALAGLRICNIYVPNGAHISSIKYQYKLSWLDKLQQIIALELIKYPQLLIVGDFNIAPADIDVYDPLVFKDALLCSVPERQQLQKLSALGFTDCYRHHHPIDQSYTWWDYRLNAFKRNLGLRIDHIFMSHALLGFSNSCSIDREPRCWTRPADHTPIVAEFTL
jgi:exodeoxyribonuclease-3